VEAHTLFSAPTEEEKRPRLLLFFFFFFFCYRPIMSHETSPPWRRLFKRSARGSGRHKVWGGAKRNPRNRWRKKEEPAKRGDSIKPGVERSGTPGIVGVKKEEPAKRGDSIKLGWSEAEPQESLA